MPNEASLPTSCEPAFTGPHRGYATARDQLRATLAHIVMAADWQAREASKQAANLFIAADLRDYHSHFAASWQQLSDDARYAMAQIDA